MSLPEFLLAQEGYRLHQNEEFLRAGVITAAILNTNRDTQRYGVLTASDIFPFLPKQKSGQAAWEVEAYTEDPEDE
jgi:hypothetical protein